ncbi:MAG: hypothetical protein IKH04_02160 [Kiritimatiellae bacterium]|nr:hypothetical protein [Kiritimatiellia bacterium]
MGSINPRDFGARADGRTKDTAAIQAAIDAAASRFTPGGGLSQVELAGGTYLSGPIQLRSGVELHIADGARLLASPDIDDFRDWPAPRHVATENLPRSRSASFIFADECEHMAITGPGTIDCNGDAHVIRKEEADWTGWEFHRRWPMEKSLPRVVFLAGCRDVRIDGVRLVNGPAGWAYWIHDCDKVEMRGLEIRCDVRYPNNDGIHINCSRDVSVSDCDIECGDDALIVRANSRSLREDRPCERVEIRDCRIRAWAGGIRIGWMNDGKIRDCSFRRIAMRDTSYGIEFVMPDKPLHPDFGREASLTENLLFEDIEMDGIRGYPIEARMSRSAETRIDAVRDITFRRVKTTARLWPFVQGRPGTPFRNFTFEDCEFTKSPSPEFDDWERHGTSCRTRGRPEVFENAAGFRFDRTVFNG